jgi:uncharacterized protein
MIRIIIYIFLGYLAYRLCKSWLRSFAPHDQDSEENSPQEADLVQDVQCGTYFLRQRGVPAKINGETLYFCSEACRDRYLQEH